MTVDDLDDLQQRWLAADRRIDEVLRLNRQIWQHAAMAAPRSSLRWLRAGAWFNLLLAALCLLGTGTFIHSHLSQPRFLAPALALHLWLIGALASEVAQLVQAAAIELDAPVVEIQRRLAALRALAERSLQLLFLFGVPVWCVPFGIVALRAWFGVDLYAHMSGSDLLVTLLGTMALGVAVVALCRRLAPLFERSPRLRRVVRGLAGHNLTAAEDRLAKVAAFAREQ